ncbi:MAG TPA: hypothetical protein VHE12_12835 [bacterium]|nr:hypothetical protein [bacterium]
MKLGIPFYYLGALGLVLTFGLFVQGPLAEALRRDPSSSFGLVILFGFAGLAGLLLLFLGKGTGTRTAFYFAHGTALISILWLILWCFVWLARMMALGDDAEMFIKHSAYLHLFGVSFAMAGYATGWMSPAGRVRNSRFLMTVGWAVSYMAWFNLYLQPKLAFLWGPAAGGLLVVLGAFLFARVTGPKVETTSPLT